MTRRADALADRLEQGAIDLADLAATLTDRVRVPTLGGLEQARDLAGIDLGMVHRCLMR